MKQLIIAEKPSVAADIAKALGKFKKSNDYYEGEHYLIASAVGHLVELCMPKDIDPNLKSWNPKNLPIVPDQFLLKPIEKTKGKLDVLKKLIKRPDVESLINACDAGREGELIFTYIYEITQCKKPFCRLWMQSMTPMAIREAFKNLRPQSSMLPLQDAARCRSEADWLIGINGTRVLTNKLYTFQAKQVATVGRVQTPTLFMVVEREQEIRAFKAQPYWKVLCTFHLKAGEYKGIYQRPVFKRQHDEDRIDRLWDQAEAEAIIKEIQEAAKERPLGLVSEEKKRSTQNAPRLYDLTTLQREANTRCGFSAKRTLQIAQSLYEKHKVITYPRTDAKALPEDYPEHCCKVLSALEGELRVHAGKVVGSKWVDPKNKRIFNNLEISDHFAIIPTDQSAAKLNDDEFKIYQLIARRFIAIFFPAAEFDITIRMSSVDGKYTFRTEGKTLVDPGWLVVHGKQSAEKDLLSAITADDGSPPKARIGQTELIHDTTKSPVRYTEASLLSAMENAGKRVEEEEIAEALKDKGLGTPATRAQTIEHLIYEKYLERDQRDLIPSAKAERLIEYLKALKIDQLTSASMTGEWEFKLRQVEQGRLKRKQFMEAIAHATREIVQKTKEFDIKKAPQQPIDCICPLDGQTMHETVEAYCSTDGRVVIPKVIGNRKLTVEELRDLLRARTIGPLDGFRSRLGKPYSAVLKLNDEHKVEFVFNNGQAAEEGDQDSAERAMQSLSQFPVIGACPVAQKNGCSCKEGKIYETPNAYICESAALKTPGCTFRVNRTLLERTIPHDEFLKLITEGKTSLLDKFRSKRTRRHFSAHLILKEDGQIGFAFAEPKQSTKAKRPAADKESMKGAGA